MGQAAEDLFHLANPSLVRLDGRTGDFQLPDGRLLELKSDFYDPSETPNFFIERWSREGVRGGPWQALDKDVSRFVYWYPKSGHAFSFDCSDLVVSLDKLIVKLKPIKVFNKGFVTVGYKVPREDLSHLYVEEKYDTKKLAGSLEGNQFPSGFFDKGTGPRRRGGRRRT